MSVLKEEFYIYLVFKLSFKFPIPLLFGPNAFFKILIKLFPPLEESFLVRILELNGLGLWFADPLNTL